MRCSAQTLYCDKHHNSNLMVRDTFAREGDYLNRLVPLVHFHTNVQSETWGIEWNSISTLTLQQATTSSQLFCCALNFHFDGSSCRRRRAARRRPELLSYKVRRVRLMASLTLAAWHATTPLPHLTGVPNPRTDGSDCGWQAKYFRAFSRNINYLKLFAEQSQHNSISLLEGIVMDHR